MLVRSILALCVGFMLAGVDSAYAQTYVRKRYIVPTSGNTSTVYTTKPLSATDARRLQSKTSIVENRTYGTEVLELQYTDTMNPVAYALFASANALKQQAEGSRKTNNVPSKKHTNKEASSPKRKAKDSSVSPQKNTSDIYDWRYVIKPVAIINTDKVYFQDIVSITGSIPQTQHDALIGKVVLDAPTELGKPFVLSEMKMRTIMAKLLGSEEMRCVYPPKVTIQRGGYVVERSQIEQRIKEGLFAQMREALQGSVFFTDYRIPDYIFMPSVGARIVVRAEKKEYGRVPIVLGIYDNTNMLIDEIRGSVVVRGRKMLPCAMKIGRSKTPVVDILGMCEVKMEQLQGKVVWDGSSPESYRIKHSIGEGDIILKTNIERIPLISKGDMVTLQYKKGSIMLQTLVTALQDAELGEDIVVQGENTKRIRAKVLNSKAVAVQ